MSEDVRFLVIEKEEQLDKYFPSLIKLLELSAADDAVLGFQKSFTEENAQQYKSDLLDQVKAGTLKMVIAADEKDNVILNCFLKGSFQETTRHIYDLQKGFIHPDKRGSGLLQQAMLFIAKTAKRNHVDVMTLDVRDGTPAHKLWKQVGFKTFGIMDDYSRYQGKSYLGHFMSITTDELIKQFQFIETAPRQASNPLLATN